MLARAKPTLIRVAAILLVAFVSLELNLRWFGGPIEIFNPLNGFHDGDPVLGWRGKPNIERRFHNPDFDVLVHNDDLGFRRPLPPRPTEASRHILILGDSLAWGWGVEQGEIFSDVLQRHLSPEIAIYNHAVNAYSTGQEYLLLQEDFARQDYDDVLLVISRTDLGDNADEHKHRPHFDLRDGGLETRNQPPPGALKNPIENFLDDHSYAINFLSWQLAALKRRLAEPQGSDTIQNETSMPPGCADNSCDTPPSETALEEVRTQPGWAVTKRLLEEIAASCREHGANLMLAYATEQIDKRSRADEVAFRGLVEQTAKEHGAAFIDLSFHVAQARQSGEVVVFARDRHWNAAGHRAAAEGILNSRLLQTNATRPRSAANAE